MVPLTLIQGADSKGAVCLYGTLPGYHLDRGFGSGANSWLIHLESFGVREMDGFGSNKRTLAVDKWIEIVNGKGYNVGEATQFHPTRSSDYQRSIPLPPGGVTAAHTSAPIPDLWRFTDPETKRKKRIATYKAYAMEGKVKSTVKKGFSWIKNRCSLVIHGL